MRQLQEFYGLQRLDCEHVFMPSAPLSLVLGRGTYGTKHGCAPGSQRFTHLFLLAERSHLALPLDRQTPPSGAQAPVREGLRANSSISAARRSPWLAMRSRL